MKTNDFLLEKAFTETWRWQAAVDKAMEKEMSLNSIREACSEEVRSAMYVAIRDGKYNIFPPHTAQIPKDEPGKFRTVYINEDRDRLLLSVVNDLLFELCPEMVHPSCLSYQKGISCGDIVTDLSKTIVESNTQIVGWKSDLSKYFDSVEIRYIDDAFDKVESKFGKSALISVVRNYYHSDWYFDESNNLQCMYQSLKQGCAVASWLADVILYPIDSELSNLNIKYDRYSDDMIAIGPDYPKAMIVLEQRLAEMGMKLNPKKVELIDKDQWVKFLGYSIKGNDISMSYNGIKRFQNEIEAVTIRKKDATYESAKSGVYRVLYKGYKGFSWASRVLRVINVDKDIDTLNGFAMDCLRAVQTGRKKLGGLGWVKNKQVGCIERGVGRNVKANKEKIPVLDGYITIGCMANAIRTSRDAFDTIVRTEM